MNNCKEHGDAWHMWKALENRSTKRLKRYRCLDCGAIGYQQVRGNVWTLIRRYVPRRGPPPPGRFETMERIWTDYAGVPIKGTWPDVLEASDSPVSGEGWAPQNTEPEGW